MILFTTPYIRFRIGFSVIARYRAWSDVFTFIAMATMHRARSWSKTRAAP
jgi:hypothetical protein